VTLINHRADHSVGWEVRNSRLAMVYWCTVNLSRRLNPEKGSISER